MKRHMKSIFKRVESGVYVKSDSEQMALEIKDLEARIALLLDIKDQAFTIHVHEKTLDEYAVTVCTMQKRIEELERQLRHADEALARRTQAVVDATLRKEDALWPAPVYSMLFAAQVAAQKAISVPDFMWSVSITDHRSAIAVMSSTRPMRWTTSASMGTSSM